MRSFSASMRVGNDRNWYPLQSLRRSFVRSRMGRA